MNERNVPEVRFRGFSGEWEKLKLSDVADIVGGGTPCTQIPAYWDGAIAWYSPTEIGKSVYADRSQRTITELGLKKCSAKMLPADTTVLFTSRAGIGDMAILKHTATTNQGFQSFVMKNGYNPYFLYSSGCYIKLYALKNASGSTFLEISGKQLGKMDYMLPEEKEQTKIGEFFKNLDNLIVQNQKKYDKLVNMKKACLDKMFPKDGADTPEVRFRGFSGKWENKELEEMAVFSKGNGFSKSDLTNEGFPIILYGRLYTKYETLILKVDTFIADISNAVISKGNEVVVPASGETAEDIARASVVGEKGIVLGGDLNIIYPNKNLISAFLALSISNGTQQREMMKRAQGKSVVHLHNSDLSEIMLKYPVRLEQTKIGTFFQTLDTLITAQKTKLEKLKNIKKACLDKMFI